MKVVRYLRLYGHFIRFAMSRTLVFRLGFVLWVTVDIVYYSLALCFYKILFLNTNSIATWNEHQAMLFVSAYLLIDALCMTLFSSGFYDFASLVNKGELDYYLVRPVSTLFFVICRQFSLESLTNLTTAVAISIWAFTHLQQPVGLTQIAVYCLLIANGVLLYLCVRMLFYMPIFWTHSARGFSELFWATEQLYERPHKIFPRPMRIFILTLLPYGLMASVPASMIIDGLNWPLAIYALGASAIFLFVMVKAWKRALMVYASASS